MPSSETTCRLCTKPSYSIKFWVTLASQPFFPPKQKSLSTHHSGSPWLECFFVFTLFFFVGPARGYVYQTKRTWINNAMDYTLYILNTWHFDVARV